MAKCKTCKGRGRVPEPGYKGRDPAMISCLACNGTGDAFDCKSCHGDGDGPCGTICERCRGTGKEPPTPEKCPHPDFVAGVTVNRLEGAGRFVADVRVKCGLCGVPFWFVGLPAGVNLNGAAVSADGEEARLAVAPKVPIQPRPKT